MAPRSGSGSNARSDSGYNDPVNARLVTHPRYVLSGLQHSQTHQYPIQNYMSNVEDVRMQRVAASNSSLPADPDTIPRSLDRRGSDDISMAATHASSSRASTWDSIASSTPSLSSETTEPSSPSEQSLGTRPSYQHYGLNEQGEVEQDDLRCPYGVLGCTASFDDSDDLEMHCRLHFRNNLPTWTDCPFAGCRWSGSSDSGSATWRERATHIATHRRRGERQIQQVGPRHEHIIHLWRAHQVSNGDRQHLQRGGELSSSPALLRAAGAERGPERERLKEERRAAAKHRREHGGS